MDFLVMPFSDDGGIDDCDNYCSHCTCNTGACFGKTDLRYALTNAFLIVGILFVAEA